MTLKVNKAPTPNLNPVEVNSITLETTTGDMLVKNERSSAAQDESQTKYAGASSLAADAKATMNTTASLRRIVIDQDLNQPDMAAKKRNS